MSMPKVLPMCMPATTLDPSPHRMGRGKGNGLIKGGERFCGGKERKRHRRRRQLREWLERGRHSWREGGGGVGVSGGRRTEGAQRPARAPKRGAGAAGREVRAGGAPPPRFSATM